jgi:16S rRNA (cytidine1402-2'-O)-methyltransferase
VTKTGALWVVATPIGNLEDITLRAIRILREADRVLAEDTRHARTLLDHYQIRTPMRPFHAHSTAEVTTAIVDELASGARLAILSDAGTPVISDPGRHLVEVARSAGIAVHVVPGASAVTAAISIAGLRCERFTFYGFLPRSGKRRRQAVATIASASEAAVLFESPRRVTATLNELLGVMPHRRMALCRELTKIHEEVLRGTPAELLSAMPEHVRGEFTVVVEANDADPRRPVTSESERDDRVRAQLARGARARAVADELATWLDIPRREAYEIVLRVKAEQEGINRTDRDV